MISVYNRAVPTETVAQTSLFLIIEIPKHKFLSIKAIGGIDFGGLVASSIVDIENISYAHIRVKQIVKKHLCISIASFANQQNPHNNLVKKVPGNRQVK